MAEISDLGGGGRGRWSRVKKMTSSRADFGLITLRTGHRQKRRTLAIGGVGSGGRLRASVEIFDPVMELW